MRMASVTDLQVCGTLRQQDFKVLGSLPNMETLSFSCPVEIQTSSPCNPAFSFQEDCLSVLNSGTSPAWPSLRTIQFGKPTDSSHGQIPTNIDAINLLGFVIERYISEDTTNSPARAARKIEKIVLYNTLTPPRFLRPLAPLVTTEIH